MELTADIGYHAFMRWGGNARHDHPRKRPHESYLWGTNLTRPLGENLQAQYDDRGLPNVFTYWDFPWMENEYGSERVKALLAGVYEPRIALMKATFRNVTSTTGSVTFGEDVPIGTFPEPVNDPEVIAFFAIAGADLTKQVEEARANGIPAAATAKGIPAAATGSPAPSSTRLVANVGGVQLSAVVLGGDSNASASKSASNAPSTADLKPILGIQFGDTAFPPKAFEWNSIPFPIQRPIQSVSMEGGLMCIAEEGFGRVYCSDSGDASKPNWALVPTAVNAPKSTGVIRSASRKAAIGRVRQVSVSNGRVYGVDDKRKMYYRNGASTGAWVQLNGQAVHIDLNSKTNEICRIDARQQTWCGKHDGEGANVAWQKIPGSLRSVSMHGKLMCGVDSKNDVFCSDNGNAVKPDWFAVPGKLRQVSVSMGGIYGVDVAGGIVHRANPRSSDWQQLNGTRTRNLDYNSVTHEICHTTPSNKGINCSKLAMSN